MTDDEPSEPSPDDHPAIRPRRLLLFGEAVLAYITYQLLTYWFLPALRDPRQTFFGDVLVNGIAPDRTGGADYLKRGIWPSWARDSYGGVPYTANIQHAVFFPGNAPFLFLKTSTALEVVIATTVAFGAWSMYLYARHALRTRLWSALLAGLAFGFGGMSLQHVVLTNQLQAIALMPLVLLAAHCCLVDGRLRHVVLLGLAIGFQFLAGHPEEWVYTLIAVMLYGVSWALAGITRDARGALLRAVRGGVRLSGGVVVFVLLFGAQLFPTLLLMSQSYRQSADFHDQFPLPRRIAANALLPDYGHRLIGENVGYIGVVALALAALGLATRRPGLRWVQIWMAVISVLGFILALGNTDPVARFLIANVPVLAGFRVPSRYLLLSTFGLAASAALGLDALLGERVGLAVGAIRARVRLGALAALVVGLGTAFTLTVGGGTGPQRSLLYWGFAAVAAALAYIVASIPIVPRALLALVLLSVTAVELQHARPAAEFHDVAPNAVYDDSGSTLAALEAIGGRYVTRVAGPRAMTDDAEKITVPAGILGQQAQYYRAGRASKVAARFNQQSVLHVETPLGRDGGLVPFATYKQFMDRRLGVRGNFVVGNYPQPPSQWNYDTLDFLAVRNFVTYPLEPAEAAVLTAHGFSKYGSYAYVDVWSRPALPLARLVYDTRVVADADQRLAALPGLGLSRTALVERPIGRLRAPSAAPTVTTRLAGVAKIINKVTTASPGLLVLADPSYPQWTVTVDGQRADLLRVDHAFKGVVVPAGIHTVVFAYDDRATEYGAVLASLTVLGLLATVPIRLIRRRRRPGTPDEGSLAGIGW